MEDEFDRIMRFFQLSPEEKDANLENVLKDSVEYFGRFKHILMHGSEEEREKELEKVFRFKKEIERETEELCRRTGKTEEELNELATHRELYSASQWDAMESAQLAIKQDTMELNDFLGLEKKKQEGSPGDERDRDGQQKRKHLEGGGGDKKDQRKRPRVEERKGRQTPPPPPPGRVWG